MADKHEKPTPDPGGDLARLLDTESQLEDMLEGARREANEVVRAAHEAAQRDGDAVARSIEDEQRRLRADLEAERDTQIAEIDRGAKRETARFDGVDEETFHRLVTHVIERLAVLEDDRRAR